MSGRSMGQAYVHAEFDQSGKPDGVTIEDAGYHTVRLSQSECFEVAVTLLEAQLGKFHREVTKNVTRPIRSEQFANSQPTDIGDWPPIQRQDLI